MILPFDFRFFPLAGWRKRAAVRRLILSEYTPPDEKIKSVPVKNYIDNFTKKDGNENACHALPDLKFCLVNTELLEGECWLDKHPCLIDAPFHFVLFFEHKNLLRTLRVGAATAGFRVRGKTIFVDQIQGHKHHNGNIDNECFKKIKVVLESLRWEKLLISAVKDWVAASGFEKMAILSSAHNKWRGIGGDQILKMHYDVTAKRMGFRKPRRGKYWVKKLR